MKIVSEVLDWISQYFTRNITVFNIWQLEFNKILHNYFIFYLTCTTNKLLLFTTLSHLIVLMFRNTNYCIIILKTLCFHRISLILSFDIHAQNKNTTLLFYQLLILGLFCTFSVLLQNELQTSYWTCLFFSKQSMSPLMLAQEKVKVRTENEQKLKYQSVALKKM